MLRRTVRLLTLVVGLSFAALLLTGCFLQNMFGNTRINAGDLGQEINYIITAIQGNATVAVCGKTFSLYNCTYIIDGHILTSTAYLASEFGLAGLVIDPVVLQIPANAISITAQYSTTASYQPAVTSVRNSFPVKPGVNITAEAGTKFVILELPSSVTNGLTQTNPSNGLPISYAISFTQQQPVTQTVEPVSLKTMLTGRVVVNGHVYYAPMLPCVTNFASVPSVTLPITTTPVNVQLSIGDVLAQAAPCVNQYYDYTNAPPPDRYLYLPLIRK